MFDTGSFFVSTWKQAFKELKPLISQFLQAYHKLLHSKKIRKLDYGYKMIISWSIFCLMDDLYRVNKLIKLSHFMKALASDSVIIKDSIKTIPLLIFMSSYICYIL